MSSPTSDASSSRDTLDDRDRADQLQQSTKDRRRERNRLAAQKHRLRRNERMSQLEAQVLALQQEKHALLARIDHAANAASAPGTTPDDHHAHHHQRAKRARTSDRSAVTAVAVAAAAELAESQAAQNEYSARLEERILELERWTEDLNGALQDAHDSATRYKNAYLEEHQAVNHAEAEISRLAAQLDALETERREDIREIAALREDLDGAHASERALRAEAQRLKESLEGAEVALDLQRVENERLRDRLAADKSLPRSADPRVLEDLDDEYRQLEKAGIENERLRQALEAAHAYAGASAAPGSQDHYVRGNGAGSPDGRKRKRGSTSLSPSPPPPDHNHPYAQITDLQERLTCAEALLASRAQQLEDAQKDAADSEREARRMGDRVFSLRDSLQKVEDFLVSKGIELNLD